MGYAIAKQTLAFLAPYGWKESQCLVTKSDVVYARQEHKCSHSLAYQYEVAGTKKTGDTWRLDPGVPCDWCKDWSSFASEFPLNSTLSCRFDPQNPNRAVLDRGNLFDIFKLLLPLGLILVGIALFRGKPALFPPTKAGVKRVCQFVAVCMFVAGVLGTIYAAVVPLVASFDSKTWNAAQCEVLASGLRVSGKGSGPGSSKQSPGYKIDIVYTYAVNGRNYVSDRYDFYWFGSAWSEDLPEIVDEYPVGEKVDCSVNPDNPYEAVLVPGPFAKYLLGFITTLLMPIGVGLWFTARRL
ncbi:MAG: DUF3592 domain-containing protein [Cytophagaceae bacterium]|nr:MAG: DUF3592 domain-containing protein [Cytophagaceae bacterium]